MLRAVEIAYESNALNQNMAIKETVHGPVSKMMSTDNQLDGRFCWTNLIRKRSSNPELNA